MSNSLDNSLKLGKKGLIFVNEHVKDPESFLVDLFEFFTNLNSGMEEFIVVLEFLCPSPWKEKDERLFIYYLCHKKTSICRYEVESVFTTNVFNTYEVLNTSISSNGKLFFFQERTITVNCVSELFALFYTDIFMINKKKCFHPQDIFSFEPIFIPKPWGQEIWFTGVEKRGAAKMRTVNSGESVPIPWILSTLSKKLLGTTKAKQPLTLVKILDPISEPIFGDLYYELHTEKNEVYVVTQINSTVGKIKIGVNPEKLKEFNNNISEFKKEMCSAIKEYEKIRREIDSIFDTFRKNENFTLTEPVPSATIKTWLKSLPTELLKQEQLKREYMDSFVGYLNLDIADVIKVPTLVPHALQHGVKVVEFQTPTYERLILSFAQKVLTQSHWDTEQAIELMQITTPKKTDLEIIHSDSHYKEEIVCEFKEFQSIRLTFYKKFTLALPQIDKYRILFHLSGKLTIIAKGDNQHRVEHHINEGECLFIPANLSIELSSIDNSISLICFPN